MDVPGMASAVRTMTSRQAVFRADASLDMGTGHIMRCLTLANALREQGYKCHFISREHPGNLIEFIRDQGHRVHLLACPSVMCSSRSEYEGKALAHAAWLGASQLEDAQACQEILETIKPQWLVVDHYALDSRWEQALKPHYESLMVIDDLTDRSHQCDLLLDQTFGRQAEDYAPWVPAGCKVLCGAHYALLRPEFAEWRPYSLYRRQAPNLKHILVTMGGVDRDNATGHILDALDETDLPAGCDITVVMGSTAPWLGNVREKAALISHPTTVLAGVSSMAQLMADSDLAIGAAGATSWERCSLGLPTIMVVLAENQRQVAHGLELVAAVKVLSSLDRIGVELPKVLHSLIQSESRLTAMSTAAAQVADGLGAQAVIRYLE